MNVFLTGAPQVGKTTLIRKFISEHPEIRLGGFFTVCGKDAVENIYIVPANNLDAPQNFQNLVGIRRDRKTPQAFPQVFDSLGTALLNTADCDLIIMDELGIMESKAKAFQKAVLDVLSANVPVLGVIKPKSTTFLDAVRSHPDSLVLEVNEGNRSFLY